MPEIWLYYVLLVFPAALAFGAAMDLITLTIPNRISIFLIGAFFVAAVLIRMPLEQFAIHIAVGVGVLVLGAGMFAMNLLGGGDAKLLAAASLWIGLDPLAAYMMYVALLGGALSLAILTYRRFPIPLWLAREDWALRLHAPRGGIPYGIAIGGAGLCVFPATIWFAAAAGA